MDAFWVMSMTEDSNSVKIRHASIDDVDHVSILLDKYRQFYGEPSRPDESRRFLMDRMCLGETQTIIAQISHVTVGFTQLFPSFSSVTLQRLWILNDLYVDEKFRGRGVGRRLLSAAADFGRRSGAKQLFIEGAVANTRARGLYEKFGFVKNSEYVYYHYPLQTFTTTR